MQWLKHMLTEGDNSTFCPVRVATAIVGVIYHAAAVAGIYFDAIHLDIVTLGQYLQHMVTMIVGGGATVGVKSVLKADASPEEK